MSSVKVDPVTMVCRDHDVQACVICMVDDFHAWLDDRRTSRRAYKQEWRETPVHERYELGGEA